MSATNDTPNYFNLHVSGIGYVNRIRWVEAARNAGRRAQPFLACSISALRGRPEDREYTFFDVRVSGAEAQGLIESLMEDVRADRKVVVGFRIGDIYPHLYERNVRDPQSGQPTAQREWASLIKGRLLLINSITVDGERTYTRPAQEVGDPSADGDDPAPDAGMPDRHPSADDEAADSVQQQASQAASRRTSQHREVADDSRTRAVPARTAAHSRRAPA
jgi:hypothetical protein